MYAIGAQLEVWFHMQHSNASAAGGETLIRVLISTLAHEKRISNMELNGFAMCSYSDSHWPWFLTQGI